jgi:hypothetical protein
MADWLPFEADPTRPGDVTTAVRQLEQQIHLWARCRPADDPALDPAEVEMFVTNARNGSPLTPEEHERPGRGVCMALRHAFIVARWAARHRAKLPPRVEADFTEALAAAEKDRDELTFEKLLGQRAAGREAAAEAQLDQFTDTLAGWMATWHLQQLGDDHHG